MVVMTVRIVFGWQKKHYIYTRLVVLLFLVFMNYLYNRLKTDDIVQQMEII